MTGNKKQQATTEKKPNTAFVLAARLRQHAWITVAIFLLSLMGVLTTYFLYQKLAVEGRDKQAQHVARANSEAQASIIDKYFNKQQQTFATFIERPWVSRALQSNDAHKITQLEKLLGNLSTDITENLIVTPGDSRLKSTTNYAAKELVFAAESSMTQPPPEAVRLSSGWAFIFVTPVISEDGDYLGAVVTTLDPHSLLKKLGQRGLPGKTALIQSIPGIPRKPVIAAGNADNIGITGRHKTDFKHWTVEFTANKNIYAQTSIVLSDIKKILWAAGAFYILCIVMVLRYTLLAYQDDPLPSSNKTIRKTPSTDHTDSESYLETPPLAQPAKHTGLSEATDDDTSQTTERQNRQQKTTEAYPMEVFREYDIRGIADTQITPDFARQLGKALGTLLLNRNEQTLITAYDSRLTSPKLHSALEEGILSTGCNTLHIGSTPTPVMNYATHFSDKTSSGVIVTASHNPADYNGFKICLNHHTATKEEIRILQDMMEANQFQEGEGSRQHIEVTEPYISAIKEDIVPSYGLHVVIDAGNGIAGQIAPAVAGELGCKVTRLYCEPNGRFPNRQPDTSDANNLSPLINAVAEHQADLGIAFDGDGDRMVAVSSQGDIVWPDELMMIFARDVLANTPGADIVFDIKSTRRLNAVIGSYGGRPVMSKTGHSNMRAKIEECDAPLGGEFSGHIFFRDRWFGFDDGIYAMARLIEIITTREQNLDKIISTFDQSVSSPEIKIPVPESEKFPLMEKILQQANFDSTNTSRLDGLRAEYPHGWGLVRASNTSPALTLRFEAESEDALQQLQSLFREQLRSIDSRLTF